MDMEAFWNVIEEANERSQGVMERKCELVRDAVAAMPPESAVAFSTHFDDLMRRAYTWDLWGAAYVINGGCSDDTFSDFRASLVSRGERAFERAVAAPDSLADEAFDAGAWFFEGFQYAVHEGAESAVSPQKLNIAPVPGEPSGAPWEESPDVLKARYPLLWKRFEAVWSVSEEPRAPGSRPWWKIW